MGRASLRRCGAALAGALTILAALAAPARASDTTQTGTLASSPPCGWRDAPSGYDHVIWIWDENISYNEIVGSPSAPVFNQVAQACGLATNYRSLFHPSFLNYVAAVSGQTGPLPFTCDPSPTCEITWPTLLDQVSAAGLQWRVYAQSMPQNCQPVNSGEVPVPLYVVHHNPAPYIPAQAANCAQWNVPLGSLALDSPAPGALREDLLRNTLPAFAFVIPDVANDMAFGRIPEGDAYLGQILSAIFISPAYRSGRTAVFITFDEGDGFTALNCADSPGAEDCHVAALVVAPSVPPGTTSDQYFDHYALLRTTEDLLGLPGHLGSAATAPSLRGPFGL